MRWISGLRLGTPQTDGALAIIPLYATALTSGLPYYTLADAMEEDPSVVVIGEDIAGAGGSFGVTRGLLDRFGPQRVFDTPISEAALAGMAVGAAMSGLKPVVEIMAALPSVVLGFLAGLWLAPVVERIVRGQ